MDLYRGGFTCVYDPRVLHIGRMTEKVYFAQDHVVVSYNGDLRGIVEDTFGKARRVRCSVPGFASLGPLIDGTRFVATVPDQVAKQIHERHPRLRAVPVPLALEGAAIELLWPAVHDDDEGGRWLRSKLIAIARER
jgi:LysR family transcriptional regulator, mexEF-oprN operon transcriptional activator